MAFYVDIISESEALRKLNLPATPRWRSYLREKLPHHDMGAGKVYDVHAVDALFRKIGDFAKATSFADEPAEPAKKHVKRLDELSEREIVDGINSLSDRRGPSA